MSNRNTPLWLLMIITLITNSMKKSYLFLFAAFCLLCLSSCEKKPAPIDDNGEEEVEYVEVGLKPKGVEVSVTPKSTRASSSDDLYGVNIWDITNYHKEGEDDWMGLQSDSYAAWLTEDITTEKIRLRKGRCYRICVVYIPNAKNVLYDYSGVYPPFAIIFGKFAHLGMGVCYGEYGVGGDNYGAIRKKGDKASGSFSSGYYFSDVDKYQGDLLVEASTDITLDVNLYKVMLGLNVNIQNMSEGYVKIRSDANEGTGNNEIILTPSNPSVNKYIVMGNYQYDPQKKDYVGSLGFIIEYYDAEGNSFIVRQYPLESDYEKDCVELTTMSTINISIDIQEFLDSIDAGLTPYIVEGSGRKDVYL